MLSMEKVAKGYLSERAVGRAYSRRVMLVARGCRRLDVNACNRYLKKRLESVSSVTVAPERVTILSLWRHAFEKGLVESMPRGLVKIRRVRPPVRAWSIDECCAAVNKTFSLESTPLRQGVSLGLFLRTWLLLGYETGGRHDDLWRLRREDFREGAVSWLQRKTGVPHFRPLSGACQQAVKEMLDASPDGRVLGWVMLQGGAHKRMHRFLKSLGMPGSSKWLRRSGATHIEMFQPGKARIHLGHKTHGMAEQHYIDWAQVNRDIPATPALLK